jgi:hypothetical protein
VDFELYVCKEAHNIVVQTSKISNENTNQVKQFV